MWYIPHRERETIYNFILLYPNIVVKQDFQHFYSETAGISLFWYIPETFLFYSKLFRFVLSKKGSGKSLKKYNADVS